MKTRSFFRCSFFLIFFQQTLLAVNLETVWKSFQVGQEVYLREHGECTITEVNEKGVSLKPKTDLKEVFESNPTTIGLPLEKLGQFKAGLQIVTKDGELATVINVYTNGAITYRKKDNSTWHGNIDELGFPQKENERLKINDSIIFRINREISSGRALELFSTRAVLVRDDFDRAKKVIREAYVGLPSDNFLNYEVDKKIVCNNKSSGIVTKVFDQVGIEYEEYFSEQIKFCAYEDLSFQSLPFSKLQPGIRVLTSHKEGGTIVATFHNGLVEVELDSQNKRKLFWSQDLSPGVDNYGLYKVGEIINGEYGYEYRIIELFENGRALCEQISNSEIRVFGIVPHQRQLEASTLTGTLVLARESDYSVVEGEIVKTLSRGNFQVTSTDGKTFFTNSVGFEVESLSEIDKNTDLLYRKNHYSHFIEIKPLGIYSNGYLILDDKHRTVVHLSNVKKI